MTYSLEFVTSGGWIVLSVLPRVVSCVDGEKHTLPGNPIHYETWVCKACASNERIFQFWGKPISPISSEKFRSRISSDDTVILVGTDCSIINVFSLFKQLYLVIYSTIQSIDICYNSFVITTVKFSFLFNSPSPFKWNTGQ